MPYRCVVGRTSSSMPRTRIEYGGCSVTNRSRCRSREAHCASTICEPEYDDDPMWRTFPCRTRSVSAPRVSSTSVSGLGRCTWYRSMWSVPSRRREFSTSRMIHRREPPRELGSSLIGMKNLVARTTSSRRPWSASPTISSDTPPEYTSAVSTKLMPASSAQWMMRMESARSSLPQGPNIMAPRHRGLTWTPVRPSGRYCMAVPFFVSGGERLLGGRDGAHRTRPAGVERQMGDRLDDLGLGEPVLPTEPQVEGQLLGVAPGDQRRDRDEAAVARGQLAALPHVAEQDVVGERDQLGREVAQHRRRGRLLWGSWHGGASLGGWRRRPRTASRPPAWDQIAGW